MALSGKRKPDMQIIAKELHGEDIFIYLNKRVIYIHLQIIFDNLKYITTKVLTDGATSKWYMRGKLYSSRSSNLSNDSTISFTQTDVPCTGIVTAFALGFLLLDMRPFMITDDIKICSREYAFSFTNNDLPIPPFTEEMTRAL